MTAVGGRDSPEVARGETQATEESAVPPPRRAGYRPEIDGLRALAVLLIVGFHVGLSGFGGGFIGVDVFFVISGYLITQILLRSLEPGSELSLPGFWARRVRRLIPALTVVIISVVVFGAVFVYSPLYWGDMTRAAAASGLWVSNLFFARQATNYFAASPSTSPFLHTWSLGVEEQFYLVWPLLFLIPVRVARRSPATARRLLATTLVSITALSFVLSLVLSNRGSPWAFFSSPTRAWEFGAAGLLAFWMSPRTKLSTTAVSIAGWLGLAVVACAALALSDRQPYPGTAALLPVVGTMLVLVPSRGEGWGPARLLGLSPLRWIGRVSYSWYLWHWPLIVFANVLVHRAGTGPRMVAALIALGLAELTRRFVEDPVRFHPQLMESALRSFKMGLAISLVAVLGVTGVGLVARVESRHDSLLRRLQTARAWSGHIRCVRVASGCVYGDPSGSQTIVLAGDSHAAHWLPALDAAARAIGDRLVVRSLGDCPLPAVEISNVLTRRRSTSCDRFRASTMRLIDRTHPAAVVVGTFSGYKGRLLGLHGVSEATAWQNGFATLARDLADRHVPLVVALDDPALDFDPIECIARHRSVSDCVPSLASATRFSGPFNDAVRAGIREVGYGSLYDPTNAICDDKRCQLEIRGQLVFADAGHLTYPFAASQAIAWEQVLRDATRGV